MSATFSDDAVVGCKLAAQIVGVNASTIIRWIRSGRLPLAEVHRGSGRTRYPVRVSDVRKVKAEWEVSERSFEELQSLTDDALVTAKEIRQIIRVSNATVVEWVKRGELQPALSHKTRAGFLYRLGDARELKHRRISSAIDIDVPDDALVTTGKAAKIVGVNRERIHIWRRNGFLKPVGTDTKHFVFRAGDVRKVKLQIAERVGSYDSEYARDYERYYERMSEVEREVVDRMVASYCGNDTPLRVIKAEAVDCVLRALNCSSCYNDLALEERLDNLKLFNSGRSQDFIPAIEEEADYKGGSDIIPEFQVCELEFSYIPSEIERAEFAKLRAERERLFQLRMAKQYRTWLRDYRERLHSIERVMS